MSTNYINNPISTDGTTMYIDSKIQAGGGGGGGSTATGRTFGTAATGSVGVGTSAQVLNLAGSTVNVNGTALTALTTSSSFQFGTSTGAVVQVGNASSGLRLGTSDTPYGAAGGYTAISELGQDVYIQGYKNPITISGALTDETTSIANTLLAANVNTTNPSFTFRAANSFIIRNANPPVFYVKAMGTGGTITCDILVNGQTIYNTTSTPTAGVRPTLIFSGITGTAKFTTRGSQNAQGVLTNGADFTVNQYDLVRVAIYSTTGISGAWNGLKCFINLN